MIERVTENVFNPVEQPQTYDRAFQALPKSEQLRRIFKFKEYLLEQEMYFCMTTYGKNFTETLADAEIKECQKDLAQAKIDWFKSIGQTNHNYLVHLKRKNYILTNPDNKNVKTKWFIRRYVEFMPLEKFVQKEDLARAHE